MPSSDKANALSTEITELLFSIWDLGASESSFELLKDIYLLLVRPYVWGYFFCKRCYTLFDNVRLDWCVNSDNNRTIDFKYGTRTFLKENSFGTNAKGSFFVRYVDGLLKVSTGINGRTIDYNEITVNDSNIAHGNASLTINFVSSSVQTYFSLNKIHFNHEHNNDIKVAEEEKTEVKAEKILGVVEYDYPTFHLTMHCILCTIVSGDLKLLGHEAAKWVNKETLRSVDWLPADKLILPEIENLPDVLFGKSNYSTCCNCDYTCDWFFIDCFYNFN